MRTPLLVLLTLTLQAGVGAQEDDKLSTHVMLPPGLAQIFVRRVIEGAMDRLEDPAFSTKGAPSSEQITERVWTRCGAARSAEVRNRQNWAARHVLQTTPSIRIAARPGFLR
jgi:hypothetical protein